MLLFSLPSLCKQTRIRRFSGPNVTHKTLEQASQTSTTSNQIRRYKRLAVTQPNSWDLDFTVSRFEASPHKLTTFVACVPRCTFATGNELEHKERVYNQEDS
jgi:hypothetical protein